jgi:hypothetical protein
MVSLLSGGGGDGGADVVRRNSRKHRSEMPLYLVEHIPYQDGVEETIAPPTDLEGLARYSLDATHGARWLTTFTPDLHDDRHFSIWEAPDAEEIRAVMTRFGFLSDGVVKAFSIRQWGPEDVLSEHAPQ